MLLQRPFVSNSLSGKRAYITTPFTKSGADDGVRSWLKFWTAVDSQAKQRTRCVDILAGACEQPQAPELTVALNSAERRLRLQKSGCGAAPSRRRESDLPDTSSDARAVWILDHVGACNGSASAKAQLQTIHREDPLWGCQLSSATCNVAIRRILTLSRRSVASFSANH
jgi:hypothetical protein